MPLVWDSPRELARETLIASQQIVSQLRGFRGLQILWFDSLMLSEGAKEEFRNGMKGIGVTIVEAQDIEVAKKVAVEQRFDVIIANYGDPQKRYAYQLLAELDKRKSRTPLVVYGMDPNPRFAKEARCYGAVTRATEVEFAVYSSYAWDRALCRRAHLRRTAAKMYQRTDQTLRYGGDVDLIASLPECRADPALPCVSVSCCGAARSPGWEQTGRKRRRWGLASRRGRSLPFTKIQS